MEMNEILEKLPPHLMSLVIDQPYNEYSARDHAVWRYVMRQNIRYLSEVAHGSYLEGLRKTGISIDHIPHMYGMNRILKDIGWAAVAVDGFIPPAAFMEFQAFNVLVIAADIRPIDQIEYTPAPDIIHEAAGHAPIIADPEYSEYLKKFGWTGARAFSSEKDYELYEAIRHLSILKADPYSTKEEIGKAEKLLADIESRVGSPSEMARIRNLHWWTVEYGLIGDLEHPRIYGAGLLSSIGESYTALQPGVKKLPYTLDAVNYNFDITTRQPQLFVTPDFKHLSAVLDEFTATMALKTGGTEGMKKAIESGRAATVVFSSGLQLTGIFRDFITDGNKLAFIAADGPAMLSYKDKVLVGQGIDHHIHGFSTPVGRLKDFPVSLESLSPGELEELGIMPGKNVELEFESGIKVSGRYEKMLRKEGKNLVMTFSDCEATYQGKILYDRSWGNFDMAVGDGIISAYSGAADATAYGIKFPVPAEKTHKLSHTPEALHLFSLYEKLHALRDKGKANGAIEGMWKELKSSQPDEWLLALEMLEMLEQQRPGHKLAPEIRHYLSKLPKARPGLERLIANGLLLADVAYH